MYSINDLVLINGSYNTDIITVEAIKGTVELYIMNEAENEFHRLTRGDVQHIRSANPNKAQIVLKKAVISNRGIERFAQIQYIGYLDLWVSKDKANKLLLDQRPQAKHLNYSTPLMEIMYEAIQEFWLTHDPQKPPKQNLIIQWLRKKGITDREASAIDSIIRPPHLKSGGQKSSKK